MTQHNDGIGDEAIYLRINQFQKWLLQFTDSCCPALPDSLEFCFAKLHTINSWLVREYGADIRYNRSLEKWVVWNDTHWQVDTGTLLYTKQLEMVRNIYAELCKAAGYRDRQDIEKYAILLLYV